MPFVERAMGLDPVGETVAPSAELPRQRVPVREDAEPAQGDRPVVREWPILLGLDIALALAYALLRFDVGLLVWLPVAALVWRSSGLYSRRFRLSLLDDVPALVSGVLCGVVVANLFEPQPMGSALIDAVSILACVVLTKGIAYTVLRNRRIRGDVVFPVAILGSGPVATSMAQRIQMHPETGLRLVGLLHDLPDADSQTFRRLGSLSDLREVVESHSVSDVVICDIDTSWRTAIEAVRTCNQLDVDIYVVPRLLEMHRQVAGTDHVWGLPLEKVRRYTLGGAQWHVKRAMDVLGAGVALLLAMPIMLAVAIAVRIELGPGVIFRQERVGLDGRTFVVRKFRSMPKLPPVAAHSWIPNDETRLGPVGSFIRRHSIDELPQLFNVLAGDMSLVGPRPERPQFVREFASQVPGYSHRHRVPVGLTGLAAVEGLRGNTSIEDRAYFDNLYIEHWSLWLDVKILIRTVAAVLKGTGE